LADVPIIAPSPTPRHAATLSPITMCQMVARNIWARFPVVSPFISAAQMRCGGGRKTGGTSRISEIFATAMTMSTARPTLARVQKSRSRRLMRLLRRAATPP
jgi:hypothetical protein